MHARVKNEGDVWVVYLMGRLDVETAEPFRRTCQQFLQGKKVVFDFKDLSFVGSSGILPFLETLQDFARTNVNGFKLASLGTEFKRVFSATTLSSIEVFESPEAAANSYQHLASAAAPAPLISKDGSIFRDVEILEDDSAESVGTEGDAIAAASDLPRKDAPVIS